MQKLQVEELLRCYIAGEKEFADLWLRGSIKGANLKGVNLRGSYLEVALKSAIEVAQT
ncbi:hypothetical protein [Chlorogloeopsis sp. ULAP02]|uniref:hypothetical protein n=1 Tax=Chlorogloeopsis sp. ULAP02 TaxID=3107926 RepID=UPI0031360FCD